MKKHTLNPKSHSPFTGLEIVFTIPLKSHSERATKITPLFYQEKGEVEEHITFLMKDSQKFIKSLFRHN